MDSTLNTGKRWGPYTSCHSYESIYAWRRGTAKSSNLLSIDANVIVILILLVRYYIIPIDTRTYTLDLSRVRLSHYHVIWSPVFFFSLYLGGTTLPFYTRMM
ncbi:hypothetical protein F4809DRAFT_168046 [Biscogniauxia mediterranea]|nr:hypothetical protein F4809DRAFT_168046 [Biscogniauxia mediterranea]